ncbi:hypothetical protein BU24DRAFT_349125 [Aaosphaeria arxii CBS 175.79]|uniref:Fe2OG dioxygenase domain-containing protein n=1 Tax=Aaosphaeria arxii CBS 175.79 TaxID=1450172 RepID=A0A6A5XP86_9PLEO|nr:uncharacterized protein BU24DRAFT_349125 [Aaosphaeria arxii CBS 175.79]KAF2014657.1 hypothetical protein BU24DRAFT_349125 [Aaosphaeria arxii CBS 175.79]
MSGEQPHLRPIAKELGDFIVQTASNYACGGAIPIHRNVEAKERTSLSAPPVVLRWDSLDLSSGVAKITLPVDPSNPDDVSTLEKLIRDCQPASFGMNGKEVLDDTYRKATKMDRSNFSTDFCPYELGIIDTIAQILLPGSKENIHTNGVKAELYKLNVYAAPSGFFKAHVDTPRSEQQFGSLVVSLPCRHEGGQLAVRHAGHSTTFDWGNASQQNDEACIQWAAFYSDCEHEVLEVTSGHRITLTYNLYYAPGRGDLADNSPAMDVKSLPLYAKVDEALKDPSFMTKGGGLVGLYCQHAYAHATTEGAKALPSALKGIDMAIYSVFRSFGLDVQAMTVLRHDISEYCNDDDDVNEITEPIQIGDEVVNKSFIGNKDKGVVLGGYGAAEGDLPMETIDSWQGDLKHVAWIRGPSDVNKNFGMAYMYGNQHEVDFMYTSLALIMDVPPAAERQQNA